MKVYSILRRCLSTFVAFCCGLLQLSEEAAIVG